MGAQEYHVQLKVSAAAAANAKLAPQSIIQNPKSANTHYLSEFDFPDGKDVELGELSAFLESNLFKVNPQPLQAALAIAEPVLENLNQTLAMHDAVGVDKGDLAKTIEIAKVTQKEPTLLGLIVSMTEPPVKLKRALRNQT